MTTIRYQRTGGTAGQELDAQFELKDMPASDAQRLHDLLNAANFFEIPVINVVPSSPDEFAYTITVVSGNSIHTVNVSDSLMPKALRPLIHDLTTLAIPTDG